ncbi:C-type lectin lectoxin-Phi1-like [Clupea harengus]|uniref:C-type lectin lectoxin-Phi1-like n=1 Tax=Clupea harengus TaxID=7950 RepID=A0A8M1KQY1_CLUHA|nr:C-type lectin lectoxin-Phi1-like [Clupea harengus]
MDPAYIRDGISVLTGKDSFVLIPNAKTWSEAQRFCREHHTDLASVRNPTENQRVQSLVPSGADAWIGLFRDAWKWSDGSNSTYTYWADSEPNNINRPENCGELKMWTGQVGRWNDGICSAEKMFLCYTVRSKQIVRVEFQVNSSLPLSDAEFQERLMDQIRRKLQEGGLPADAKLTWKKQPDGQIFHKKNEKKEKKERKRKSKDEF